MATAPGAPDPDRIEPRSPPERPYGPAPAEEPLPQPPDFVPDAPDFDQPDSSPGECPPPS